MIRRIPFQPLTVSARSRVSPSSTPAQAGSHFLASARKNLMTSTAYIAGQRSILLHQSLEFARANARTDTEGGPWSHRIRDHHPTLAIIQTFRESAPVHQDAYIKSIETEAHRCKIAVEKIVVSADFTTERLLRVIRQKNHDSDVHGILLPSPLPPGISRKMVAAAISLNKDVECVHPDNVEMFRAMDPPVWPPAVHSTMQLLRDYNVAMFGMNVLVIGDSNTLCKPMDIKLRYAGCRAHKRIDKPKDKAEIRERLAAADVIIIDAHHPEYLHGDDVKEGVVIIDAGHHQIGRKIVGDVHFESVAKKAAWITPATSGIGPMTVFSLLRNLLHLAQNPLGHH